MLDYFYIPFAKKIYMQAIELHLAQRLRLIDIGDCNILLASST